MTGQEADRRTPAVGLGLLDEEHSEIHRSFVALDEAIVRGRGLPQILAAAEDLTQLMLLHFIHEVQFLEKVSFSVLKDHRRVEMEIMAGIGEIDTGLRRRELSAALRLRTLCKEWIHGHMYMESESSGMASRESSEAAGMFQA